jgi:hypothetical protein
MGSTFSGLRASISCAVLLSAARQLWIVLPISLRACWAERSSQQDRVAPEVPVNQHAARTRVVEGVDSSIRPQGKMCQFRAFLDSNLAGTPSALSGGGCKLSILASRSVSTGQQVSQY